MNYPGINYPATLSRPLTVGWLVIFISVLIWSAVQPKDGATWVMEVAPAVIALIVMVLTAKSFPLTSLVYFLILIHCVILMVGGHYTYAEVPAFDWIRDFFGQDRNNYDKFGHFAQGFIPAMVAREVLVRKQVINGGRWLNFMVLCFCLAVSAFYELIEWWAALAMQQNAEAFLGTQGYLWDTQSDMMFALIGATCALLLLSKLHDRELVLLAQPQPPGFTG